MSMFSHGLWNGRSHPTPAPVRSPPKPNTFYANNLQRASSPNTARDPLIECFTERQSQKLWQYHKVNQLLIDCLKSECRISRSVREEIEETLFLPLEAIEQWKRERRLS